MDNIPQPIAEVLRAGRIEGTKYYLPPNQLERKVYEQVNEVLSNAGGKWSRKEKAHVFDFDPSEKLGLALETGKTVNEKKLYQFFETPEDVAKRVVDLADIRDGMTVLEPSAGHGAILDMLDKSLDIGVVFVEVDEQKCKVLESKGYQGECKDFMEYGIYDGGVVEAWDRIIMNPPFTKQQDIDHVSHAYSMLYSGGKLVAVMSPSFTFRTNKKSLAFKELVDKNGSWERNAENAFKESGTGVNSVIVVLNKP